MKLPAVYFAIPGDIRTLTGGYGYDRRLLAGLRQLGLNVVHQPLDAGFPAPTAAALAATDAWLQSLPDATPVLVDGLAFGVMDTLTGKHGKRLRFIALCHHPLGMENGLDPALQQQLLQREQAALAAARAVVVTSARTKQLLHERLAVPTAAITVAQPGTERRGFAH
ncbi:MAG TPA: hypothetical protein VMH83_10265, partial [Candidatus Acidoferrum sp.]|nr:hypothetical protein [Candidatus Acidoferrum sp.]